MTPQQIADLDQRFAERISAERKLQDLSLESLARRSGVSRGRVSQLDLGKLKADGSRHPRARATVGESIALAQALGVQVAQLLAEGSDA